MKKGWQTKTLGDVCSFENGDRGTNYPSRSARTNCGIPFINAGHLTDEGIDIDGLSFIPRERFDLLSNGKIRRGDILFCLRGSLGKFANVGSLSEGAIASSLVIVRPSESVSNGYINAYFQSELCALMINRFKNGAAQPNLSAQSLRKFTIPIPPLPEQQRIVRILDEAFDGIAIAKANAEKNLQNASKLFESYLNSVFTQHGSEWADKKLGEVCGFVRGPFGGSLKKSIFVPDGYAVYEQRHAIYNQFDDVRYFIDEAKFKEMKRFELSPNDLIMSCSGTMGRVAIVPKSIKRGIINQALLKLTPTTKIKNTFLKFWMESESFQNALKEYSGGAAIQNVAEVKVLKEIKILLPSIAEQEHVVESLDELLTETLRLESIYQQKLEKLEALKKSLLNEAFNGVL